MRILGKAFLIIGAIILSNCGSSNKFIVGSNYDPTFDPQKMDNMAIIFHDVDETDEDFWDHKSSKDKTPEIMEQELYQELSEVFLGEGINIIDKRISSSTSEGEDIREESIAIRNYLYDLKNAGSLTFSYQSSIDYKSLVNESDSKYALILITDPYSVTSTSYGGAGGAPTTSYTTTWYEYGIMAYIVDVQSNKIVWLFNNSEYVDLYTFDYKQPQLSAFAALFLGRDLRYESFDIDNESATRGKLYIKEYSGNEYTVNNSSINQLTLNIQIGDSTFTRHLREIEKIQKYSLDAQRNVTGRVIYPKFLK
ncbi:MAG: hypothetical protein JJ895_06185 [Balneolaceae bacterium]|nr:hypothetical protein [Balneolaceae bacterium]